MLLLGLLIRTQQVPVLQIRHRLRLLARQIAAAGERSISIGRFLVYFGRASVPIMQALVVIHVVDH